MKKGPTILVADDEESLLKLLKLSFGLEGFDVVTANDGLAAQEAFEGNQPDAAVLDIGMPGIDGFGVLGGDAHDKVRVIVDEGERPHPASIGMLPEAEVVCAVIGYHVERTAVIRHSDVLDGVGVGKVDEADIVEGLAVIRGAGEGGHVALGDRYHIGT